MTDSLRGVVAGWHYGLGGIDTREPYFPDKARCAADPGPGLRRRSLKSWTSDLVRDMGVVMAATRLKYTACPTLPRLDRFPQPRQFRHVAENPVRAQFARAADATVADVVRRRRQHAVLRVQLQEIKKLYGELMIRLSQE